MSRYSNSVPQMQDGNGTPIVGAKKFFFEPGTTTKKTIYSDSALTVSALNPQISDADGRYSDNIFLDGLYKEEQQDNTGTASGYDGVTLWTKDPVGDVTSGSHSLWVSDSIYNIPEIVLGSDDNYYESLTDNNQGNNPISNPASWAKITFVKAGVVDGVTTINDSNSNEVIKITATSSAVNEITIANAATGNKPSINQTGDDDVGVDIEGVELKNGASSAPNGYTGNLTGSILDANGNQLLTALTTASAVNEITVSNAATGNGPSLSATGDDANIDINITTKGAGAFRVNGDEISLARRLIQSQTASSSATIDFTTGITSAYKAFEIEFDSVVPSASPANLQMRLSNDGGSTWIISSYIPVTSSMRVTLSMNNTAIRALTGSAIISSAFNASEATKINGFSGGYIDSSGDSVMLSDSAAYIVAEVTDAFRFLMSSGSITSGTFRLYGIL